MPQVTGSAAPHQCHLKLVANYLIYADARNYNDVIRTYRQLVAQGVDHSSILLAGDSAGGGLCLAALVALREAGGTGMPAGAVLLSPWVDLSEGSKNCNPEGSFKTNHLVDYLPHDLVSLFADAYAGVRHYPTAI